MLNVHPVEIKGAWNQGYVLDIHTVSSTMIGYNEHGFPEFDTVRSPLGELVYRVKYRAERSAVPGIVSTIVEFLRTRLIVVDTIVPMPPSKQRNFQPVVEIASEAARALGAGLNATSLSKAKATPQMKDVGDFQARSAALHAAFTCDQQLAGKRVLLLDDLYQSGASMNVAARALKEKGLVKWVFALALTRTRS